MKNEFKFSILCNDKERQKIIKEVVLCMVLKEPWEITSPPRVTVSSAIK